MKQNRLHICMEFLITQINMLIFYSLSLVLAAYLGSKIGAQRPHMLLWMLTGLLSFGLYFVRRHVRHVFPLVLLHILALTALVGYCWLISANHNLVGYLGLLITGTGFVIYSLVLRFTTEDFQDQCISMPFTVAVYFVSAILAFGQVGPSWNGYFITPVIIIFGLYFLVFYLRQYLEFINANASSTGALPEKAIFRAGLKQVLIYIGIGLIFLIGVVNFNPLGQLILAVAEALRRFIGWLLNTFGGESPPPEGVVIRDPQYVQVEDPGLPEVDTEPWIGWVLLEYLIMLALIVGAAILAILLLRRFVRFLMGVLQKGREFKDITTGESVDVREKCEITEKKSGKKERKKLFAFLEPREKIRRIYKGKVTAYQPRPLMDTQKKKRRYEKEKLPCFTAREMEYEMDSKPFAKLYEKARYSQLECTAEDVKQMKELCGN